MNINIKAWRKMSSTQRRLYVATVGQDKMVAAAIRKQARKWHNTKGR
jgi:hypothetical protein